MWYEAFLQVSRPKFYALFLGYWHCGHFWRIVSASGDSEDDCEEADGM
jgi:hypothetical protein